MRVVSPYFNSKSYIWAKGNLHSHTSISDGLYTPQEIVNKYASNGYDFLMISEHDMVYEPNGMDSRGMILIKGSEVTLEGPHILHVNATNNVFHYPDRQKVINEIVEDGGFAIINHPNWEENFNHCPQALLEALQNYTGIEIYNGIVRRLPGNPNATDRWDLLLSKGRIVWGFANDDAHWEETFCVAWNVAQVEKLSLECILDALKNGRFYASTGVEIQKIEVKDRTFHISTRNATKCAVISMYGRRIFEVKGKDIVYELEEDLGFPYIRFEFWGEGEEQAWTQPFLIDND
ncbi:MAG: CehA/McbA family metallohydrolase [Candidatus Hydrogenedentes bacterium]|nr:CehA/McbA family metallohydrolase [Candidatus Hydrogenedentota bacterium]